jgi:hypothetical protein
LLLVHESILLALKAECNDFLYFFTKGVERKRIIAKTFRLQKLSLMALYISWDSLVDRPDTGQRLPADPEFNRSSLSQVKNGTLNVLTPDLQRDLTRGFDNDRFNN